MSTSLNLATTTVFLLSFADYFWHYDITYAYFLEDQGMDRFERKAEMLQITTF